MADPAPASYPVCANCGGTYRVTLRSPDLDIAPVPLCVICVVAGFDWRERLGLAEKETTHG